MPAAAFAERQWKRNHPCCLQCAEQKHLVRQELGRIVLAKHCGVARPEDPAHAMAVRAAADAIGA